MASDIWQRTTQIAKEETRCRHMGYSFRLAARLVLYASSHRQDSIYHGHCYTSRRALAGTIFMDNDKYNMNEMCVCVCVCVCVLIYVNTHTKGCGIYYPVCGMMHIQNHLLLIGMSSGRGFPLTI